MTRAKTSDQSTPGSYAPKTVTAPSIDELTPDLRCPGCADRGFIDVMVDGAAGEQEVAQEPCDTCSLPATRAEIRGLAEDFTDRQGNVYRLDVLNLIDGMDAERGPVGLPARQEMRAALVEASDEFGNVCRRALHAVLDGLPQTVEPVNPGFYDSASERF